MKDDKSQFVVRTSDFYLSLLICDLLERPRQPIGGFVCAQLFSRDRMQQLKDPLTHFSGRFSSAETKPFNLEPALIEGRVLVSGTWDEMVFVGVSLQNFVRRFQKGTGRP